MKNIAILILTAVGFLAACGDGNNKTPEFKNENEAFSPEGNREGDSAEYARSHYQTGDGNFESENSQGSINTIEPGKTDLTGDNIQGTNDSMSGGRNASSTGYQEKSNPDLKNVSKERAGHEYRQRMDSVE